MFNSPGIFVCITYFIQIDLNMRPTRPKKVQNVPGTRPNVRLPTFSNEESKDQKSSTPMMSMWSTNNKMTKIRYATSYPENRRSQ